MKFQTNTTEKMRITSDGKVGIGTSSPSTSLHISQSQPIITLTDTDTSTSHQLSGQSGSRHFNLKVDTGGSSGSPVFNLSMQDNIKLSVLNDGNVGIGTTTPGRTLDVAGIVRSSTAFALGGNTSTPAEGSAIYRPASDNLAFVTNNNERLRIDSSGNVGIGTSSPSNLLHLTSSQNGTALQIANTVDTNGIRINSGVSGLASNSLQFLNSSGDSLLIIDGTNKSTIIGNIGYTGYRASFGDFEVKNLDGSGNSGGTLVLSNTDGSIVSGQHLGNLTFASYDQSGASTTGGVASIRAIASETYSSTSGAYLSFLTHPASANDGTVNGNMVERMRIDSSGNVLVGTTDSTPASSTSGSGISLRENGSIEASRDGSAPLFLNRSTSNGDMVDFYYNGVSKGTIEVFGGATLGMTFRSNPQTGPSGIRGAQSSIIPYYEGADKNNELDLGSSSTKWKDIYLGGGAFIGGTGTANKLSDYEEGTWTPEITPATGSFSAITYSNRNGHYTKIGNIVYFTMFLRTASSSNFSGASGGISITGLPFSASSTPTSRAGGSFFTSFDRWNSNSILDGSIIISTSITPSSSSIGLGSIITSSGDALEFSVSNLRDASSTDNRIGLTGFYMTDA